MPNLSFTVTFTDGKFMEIKNKSFSKAIQFILDYSKSSNLEPIKLEFSTGKVLYFDKPKFQSYVDNDLEQPDLIADTICDGLYRNTVDIVITKHDIIDSGYLWKLNHGKYILIDEERYIPIQAPDSNFIKI